MLANAAPKARVALSTDQTAESTLDIDNNFLVVVLI